MRLQLALTALLATMTTDALASDWQLIGDGSKGKVYVEAESITRDGGVVRAWVKWNYDDPQTNPKGDKYLSERDRVVFRCEQQQYALASYSEFSELDLQGAVVGSGTVREEWSEAAPDTVAMSMLEFVCTRAPSK